MTAPPAEHIDRYDDALVPTRTTWLRRGLLGLYVLCLGGLMTNVLWLYAQGCGISAELSIGIVSTEIAGIAAFATLGILILAYRSGNRIGWLCCLIAVSLGTSINAYLGIPCAIVRQSGGAGLPYVAWFAFAFLPLFGVLPLFILTPLLFPTGKFLGPRWARVTWIGIGGVLITSLALGFLPDFRRHNAVTFSMDLENPFGVQGLPDWWYPFFMTSALLLLSGLCFLGVASIVVRYRRSVGDERQQLKWLAFFLVTVVSVQLLAFEIPGNLVAPAIFYTIWYDLIIAAMILGFPLTIGIAIFKYRLYDIDLIINRTLVYGALTVLVIALYALIVVGLGRIFHDANNFVMSLLATAVIAVVFQPARDWLQTVVNRRLFGDRDDPASVLTRLTRQMDSADSGDALMSSVVDTIASSLKLPYVAVWIRGRDGEETIGAQTGAQPHQVEVMPLLHQQETIGRLVVAPRSPGEALTLADRNLLIAIARLVATTTRTIQLTDAVQEARVRTVGAREEERRRLRRDLHDGLGPVLAGQGLKLAAARQVLREHPETAERLLDEVMAGSERTIAEVRRLVYALRPPTLDELGLVGAIREHVENMARVAALEIEVNAPPTFPEISAAIEVAVLRIVQEALSNVVRHAHATRCRVTLTVAQYSTHGEFDRELVLCVEDDGVGLPSRPRAGIGLQSMRERAAEVGGLCRFEAVVPHGTRVCLTTPIVTPSVVTNAPVTNAAQVEEIVAGVEP